MEILAFAKEYGLAPWDMVPDEQMTWFLRWRAIGVARAKRYDYLEELRENRG